MFFLPLDFLTVIMVILFVANMLQSLAHQLHIPQPNEGLLVLVSATLGYTIYTAFSRHFHDGYTHFEKLTVAMFGSNYWITFLFIAAGFGAAFFALRRA